MSKKASKSKKSDVDDSKSGSRSLNSDMPESEKIKEQLTFRKTDPWGKLYFTPTRGQYNRLKDQARARHPGASLPVFYDNYDDIITVRAAGSKDGWDEGHRLKKGVDYVVTGMLKTAVIKGHPSTFIRILSVEGDLSDPGLKKDKKKKKKKADVKVDIEEDDEEDEDEDEEEDANEE